jgi:hypothetical protein
MVNTLILIAVGIAVGVVAGMFIAELNNSHKDLW